MRCDTNIMCYCIRSYGIIQQISDIQFGKSDQRPFRDHSTTWREISAISNTYCGQFSTLFIRAWSRRFWSGQRFNRHTERPVLRRLFSCANGSVASYVSVVIRNNRNIFTGDCKSLTITQQTVPDAMQWFTAYDMKRVAAGPVRIVCARSTTRFSRACIGITLFVHCSLVAYGMRLHTTRNWWYISYPMWDHIYQQ